MATSSQRDRPEVDRLCTAQLSAAARAEYAERHLGRLVQTVDELKEFALGPKTAEMAASAIGLAKMRVILEAVRMRKATVAPEWLCPECRVPREVSVLGASSVDKPSPMVVLYCSSCRRLRGMAVEDV